MINPVQPRITEEMEQKWNQPVNKMSWSFKNVDIFWNSTFFAIYSVESFLTVPIIISTNDLLDNIAWVTGVFAFVAHVGRNFHDLLFVLMRHEHFVDRMFYLTSNLLIQLLSRNFESGQIWPLDLYYSDFVIGLFLDAISSVILW